jgi:glycosyltransferase involved in cell wall biosynthesis
VQRRALRGFDAVIAVSRALSSHLSSQGVPANRLRMIQNAFPGAVALQSRREARARLGITDERFQLGWVGRLSHEKGPDQMIDALALLDTSKVALTIIGDGPERARLQAQAERLEVASAIRWAGNQSSAAQLFSAFDAFVLSSRTEGIPMVLFEAMAAGIPIVATRVGGVPEVLDDSCAYLVESGDGTQLASAIETLRTDPRFAARIARARQRLDTQFSTDAWIDRHKALYCEFQRLPEDACLALSH